MENKRGHPTALLSVFLLLLTACGGGAEPSGSASTTPSTGSVSASPSEPAPAFSTAAFAEISEGPVPAATAAKFEAALRVMAGGGGMAATVMSPDGTWSGAVGKADGVRGVGINDQFAIGSVTKTVIAAQLMQMVEAGELALDDPATNHLPKDLKFDTNRATIRQLLGMRSGIPDYWSELRPSLSTDRQRVWTTADMLKLVPAGRTPVGVAFDYSNTNYLLLQLVIEQVRRRPVVAVLRAGVLKDGPARLIYQPDERPTKPMAMPNGESADALKKGGGYLPSRASATAGPTTGAMATDAPSLARWWRAFCSGEIVSRSSISEMATFDDVYGLGLYQPYSGVIGHTGEDFGYAAWAGCLPEEGSVIVVLHNREVDDMGPMAGPLVLAARSD